MDECVHLGNPRPMRDNEAAIRAMLCLCVKYKFAIYVCMLNQNQQTSPGLESTHEQHPALFTDNHASTGDCLGSTDACVGMTDESHAQPMGEIQGRRYGRENQIQRAIPGSRFVLCESKTSHHVMFFVREM